MNVIKKTERHQPSGTLSWLYLFYTKTERMKYFILPIAISLFFMTASFGQTVRELPPRAYELYPTLQDMYGYAVGKHNDYLLIFGGRIRSEVPEQYSEDFPNLEILMIDFKRQRASAYTSGNLEGVLGEQMSATGLAYYQEDTTLYLLGGYGFSESSGQFITFPYLTAINLKATIDALLKGENPVAHFYQLCDDRMAIFDATMDYNGDEFFLINGKSAYKLEPFSDQPEYVEETHEGEARTFKINKQGKSLEISQFQTWYDLEGFRDYYGPLLPEAIEKEFQLLLQGQGGTGEQ